MKTTSKVQFFLAAAAEGRELDTKSELLVNAEKLIKSLQHSPEALTSCLWGVSLSPSRPTILREVECENVDATRRYYCGNLETVEILTRQLFFANLISVGCVLVEIWTLTDFSSDFE